jgi:hypothetical protein
MLWIDCLAGLSGALSLGLLAGWLAQQTGLPSWLILRQARINLTSFGLTRLSPCPRPWLAVLVLANYAYALFCLALLVHYASLSNPWGWLYLTLEAAVVAGLAGWERRVFFPALQQSFRPPC